MDEKDFLAERFEADRAHLERVAYRMLGSLPEAQDAVQESWLRLARADTGEVGNLTGWLTTVVARICLDMLRSRKARREEPADPHALEPAAGAGDAPDHERELADSVGIALLVVLQALEPAERIVFVLHDLFELPFDEISPILGRSADATRQLASRARRRVRGAPKDENAAADRRIVEAFLAAARKGDFESLLSLLDPNVVVRSDATILRMGGMGHLSGAAEVAKVFQGRAQAARVALVDGKPGFVVAPRGRLLLAVEVTVVDGRITFMRGIADPAALARTELSLAD
ncbi:MAG TPA: sigma-70 family RNA polymerase sigma factor [Rhizomicrobium sp.]|nr:sigma-70 family RNA polymerase sigma factor [Rhizomicrobium sp.]